MSFISLLLSYHNLAGSEGLRFLMSGSHRFVILGRLEPEGKMDDGRV